VSPKILNEVLTKETEMENRWYRVLVALKRSQAKCAARISTLVRGAKRDRVQGKIRAAAYEEGLVVFWRAEERILRDQIRKHLAHRDIWL
jgi:hypothetical protein